MRIDSLSLNSFFFCFFKSQEFKRTNRHSVKSFNKKASDLFTEQNMGLVRNTEDKKLQED